MTTTADPVANAFEAALAKDAGRTVAPPPDIPPPPPVDPDAPHGRDGNGQPLTPHGVNKRTGQPNKKPPGPGRPKTATTERPAPASPPPRAGAGSNSGEDFAGDLQGLADSVWMGASALKGGKLGPVRLPDTRAYALAWHQASPNLVATWTAAANQNPTVRGYVRKLSGEGSWSWVIGVAISAAGLASGLAAVASATAEEKAQLVAVNDQLSEEYVRAQMLALGMEIPQEMAA